MSFLIDVTAIETLFNTYIFVLISIIQPINQAIDQASNHSIKRSSNPAINQATNRAIE